MNALLDELSSEKPGVTSPFYEAALIAVGANDNGDVDFGAVGIVETLMQERHKLVRDEVAQLAEFEVRQKLRDWLPPKFFIVAN